FQQLSPERLRLRHVHHALDQERPDFRQVHHLLEEIPDLIDLAEPGQDRLETMVLPPRLLQVDDVVVKEILTRRRRDREQLRPRRVADHPLQRPDLGRYTHPRSAHGRTPSFFTLDSPDPASATPPTRSPART